jgi:acetoin utilization deacetylase AcuC-like enzyme
MDIDFHHENGIQEIFYRDPTVFFCSLHGHPDFAYPYVSGLDSERGEGHRQEATLIQLI